MKMVDGIATVWLPVTDMSRARNFYADVLGLEVEQADEEWSMLRAGQVLIGLNGREEESPRGSGGAVPAFKVSGSIEDAAEELSSRGVEVPGGVTEHPWGKIAPFKDPDGNDLQLYEAPAS
ncbi:MAG: VOC family protein [Thermoleophilaceae bacterium]